MPKQSAADREDEILELICAKLSGEDRKLEIIDRPDRRPRSEVPPVDAIIRVVEGDYEEEWAADVCLTSKKFNPHFPPAMKELQNAILAPLTELAQKVNRTLSINCRVYVRPEKVSSKQWKTMMAGYHRNIYDRVVMALFRPDGEWTDPEVSVVWRVPGEVTNGPQVRMSYGDPYVYEGFQFSPAVRRKLEGQLRRARDAGYRTLLVLDQEPPRNTPWIGDILPTPYEIGEGIAFAVAHCRTTLDAAVLVNDSSVYEVYHRVGKQVSPYCPHCQSICQLKQEDNHADVNLRPDT
jgi:thiol-disulfide isomerase/thioredoxin